MRQRLHEGSLLELIPLQQLNRNSVWAPKSLSNTESRETSDTEDHILALSHQFLPGEVHPDGWTVTCGDGNLIEEAAELWLRSMGEVTSEQNSRSGSSKVFEHMRSSHDLETSIYDPQQLEKAFYG